MGKSGGEKPHSGHQQAVGIVNDHLLSCDRREACLA